MKKTLPLLFLLLLSACDTWGVPPQPFPVWSPIPSITPSIVTATPLIVPPPALTVISQVTETASQPPPPTFTLAPALPTHTFIPAPIQSVAVDILGCNTSIDILNAMGEVTNAYVTVKNTGTLDLPNACGLLRAIDEGTRAHPDKKVCVSNLPVQSQVILKLTVDSTYQQDTMIQVDILSNEVILLRVDRQSCRDISLFGGAPADVGVIKPIQP